MHDNQVELWQWNDATKQLSSIRVPAAEARIIWMSKLARTLTQLQPQNPDYQRRALVLAWEAESVEASAAQLAGESASSLPRPIRSF